MQPWFIDNPTVLSLNIFTFPRTQKLFSQRITNTTQLNEIMNICSSEKLFLHFLENGLCHVRGDHVIRALNPAAPYTSKINSNDSHLIYSFKTRSALLFTLHKNNVKPTPSISFSPVFRIFLFLRHWHGQAHRSIYMDMKSIVANMLVSNKKSLKPSNLHNILLLHCSTYFHTSSEKETHQLGVLH